MLYYSFTYIVTPHRDSLSHPPTIVTLSYYYIVPPHVYDDTPVTRIFSGSVQFTIHSFTDRSPSRYSLGHDYMCKNHFHMTTHCRAPFPLAPSICQPPTYPYNLHFILINIYTLYFYHYITKY